MLEDAILVRQVARSLCELLPDRETYIELLQIGKVDAVLFRATVPPPIPRLTSSSWTSGGVDAVLFRATVPPPIPRPTSSSWTSCLR